MPFDPTAEGSLIIGPLDAERAWLPSGGKSLHIVRDGRATLPLDHLLILVARPADLLVTTCPGDPSLYTYHAGCGLACTVANIIAEDPSPEDLDAVFTNHREAGARTAACVNRQAHPFREIKPYAVTPYTQEVVRNVCPNQPLPDIDTVRQVNSKVWGRRRRRIIKHAKEHTPSTPAKIWLLE